MRKPLSFIALVAFTGWMAVPVQANEIFAKPHDASGDVNPSSWVPPDGTDSDTYSWDEFLLPETQIITEVRWRGGYALNAPYGHATDFRVSFFDSAPNGLQPLITALPTHESQETVIATFHTNNSARERFAGVFNGRVLYDYQFTLPTPVTIPGNTLCWFRVVASQPTQPDWGMATGVGGNGAHFRYSTGTTMFRNWPHDLAFALDADWVNVGNGLAGTSGVPTLVGSGSIATQSTFTLSLSNARPSSLAWMVGGLSRIDLPFFGGVLVPAPTSIVSLSTSPTGTASFTFNVPTGLPPGTDLVTQAWVLDPLAVRSLAASNGLVATTP